MAIYHTHISSGSRDDGQSAAVKVAYILREGAYGGRGDLVKWGSGNMPAWAFTDPRRLFAAADLYERANGRLFVHVWVALPNELNALQRHQLVLAIVAAMAEAGLPYVYAIHAGDPKSEGEPANPHAHFVLSERVNDGIARDERQWFKRANRRNPVAGGAAKDRSLKELTWVEDTRKRVEELTNEHLDRAECEERVTADSHAKRIAVADAEGDQETAEYLRLHPPGIHLGPAAAAMERDRYRGKKGEEPELARTGEPTERGNVARAKAAEKERTRRELERVSKDLHRAREEERCAMGSVALARSVWLSDAEILDVYKKSESVEAGTGWVGIAAAAELLAGWKDQAQAEAESFGIDVEAVVRGAHARGENAVTAVQQAIGIFQDARLALMTNEVIARIQAEAESSDSGSGWGAVAEVVRTRLAWKARTEAAAREAGIGDIDDIYTAAWSREEDPLPALEAATAEREYQARIVSEARAALLTDAAIARIREEAEVSEPGSGWAAVEAATAVQAARKEQAEAGAVAAGVFEIEAVYAGAWKWREDPVAALEEATAIFAEARAALLPDVEIWRIHDAAESAEPGSGWASVKAASASRQAQKEGAEAGATTFGLDIEGVYAGAQAGGADPVVALEEKVAEEERLASERRAAVEQREGSVTATKQGRAWLLAAQQEALGGSGGQLTLEQREKIVETVYQRLDEALRDSESALRFKTSDLDRALAAAEQERERRETRLWEEQRDAGLQALAGLLGGMDLYHAHLADLDPKWDSKRNNKSSRENIDAALAAAGSDAGRLGRFRVVLSDKVDAARYQEELGKVAGQFKTSDLDRALAAAEQEKAARVRREARHQMVSDTPGGDERLRAAGWEKARTDSGQERVLTTVERDLTADFDRREKALRTDNQGDEFLRRARLAVLVADREAATLAERGRVIERAEMDREAARRQATSIVARKRQQEEEAARRREEEAARQQEEEAARRREEEAARQQKEEAARRREEEAARQQEEERQRRELAGREAAVRATSSGSRRLDGERRARFGTAKRSLPVGEELLIAKAVELQITEDLTRRETENAALAGGTALLRAVKKRRGPAGPSDSLAEREEMVVAVEQRLRAGDAVEVLLPTTAPDAEHRPDYLVPAVPDAALDQAVTADDPLFVQDVVFVLRERYAHRAQDAENGYDAAARTASQQRYLGSALASALQWCVLKIRELILKACQKILGSRSGEGERVQSALATTGTERREHQRAAESAAEKVAIEVEAFSEAARASGQDPVAVLEQETARRQQVLDAAEAAGVDYQAVYAAAEAASAGSGFDAIEAATERQQEAESKARGLGIDVYAVYAAARSKNADPLVVLEKETERSREVISYVKAIGFPIQELDAIWGAAEAKRPGSGYTTVRAECVRRKAREEMRKVLPFEAPDRARPGARVLAVYDEMAEVLLREVEDDEFAHGILSEVLAESAGSTEEREQAADFYHRRQIQIEQKRLERERSGWFSSKPTQEEAKQAVLKCFVPVLAARVRKACDVHDLDSLMARAVEEDRERRVVDALASTLLRASYPGVSSQRMAVSDERLDRITARTGDAFVKEFIAAKFLEGYSGDAYGRSRAEEDYLGPRIRKKEQSGLRREQAEAAVHEEYEVELLRRIEAVWREVQPRAAAEVWRERAKAASVSRSPADAPSPARGADEQARRADWNWSV